MKHYERYVLGSLMQAFGFFCLILILAYWINRSLGIFNNLIGDGQSTFVFIELIFLFLPQVIAIVLPISAIASTIVVINKLGLNSELIILDAAGIKPFNTLKPFLYFAIISAFLMTILSLFLVPMSRNQMEYRNEEISKDIISKLISEGSFLHPVPNMTIFVSSVNAQGELIDIFIHDQRSIERDLTYIATRAVLVKSGVDSHLVLFNGLLQTLDKKSNTLSHIGFNSLTYELTTLFAKNDKKVGNIDNYGVIELLNADQELLDLLNQSKERVNFEAHDRILKPLHCALYILLASVIMNTGVYSRVGMLRQIFFSILAVLIVNFIATSGLTLVRRDNNNWLFGYLPVIFGFCLTYFLFLRTKKPLVSTNFLLFRRRIRL